PAVVTRFAGAGYRVEAPRLFSGPRIQRDDEAADAELLAADADNHFVLHHERRQRDRISELDIGQRVVPDLAAAPGIDRDDVRVERPHEQRVAEDRDAAVVGTAADACFRRRRIAVEPEDA